MPRSVFNKDGTVLDVNIVTGSGDYLNVGQPFDLKINQGLIAGHRIVDKFGENPDIDTLSAPEDIWDFGGLYTYDANGTAPIVSLISDNALDTMNISVTGLDINGNEVNQTITLTGTTRVALTTPLWRVYRLANEGVTGEDLIGTVYCYTGVGGVPTAGNVRAVIDNGNNQSLMALFTIPKGEVGFLYRGELGTSRNKDGDARCSYYSRRFEKVFRIKKRIALVTNGSSTYQDHREFPDVIPSLTDIKLTAETASKNDMGVFGTFDILLIDETLFPDSYLQSIGQPGY